MNADDTSLRYRVCCGGSIISIIVPTPASGPMSGSMIPPASASGAFSDEKRLPVARDRDDVFVLGDDPEAALVALGVGRRVEPHRRLAPQEGEPLVRERVLEPVHVGEIDVAELHATPSGSRPRV